MRLSLSLVKLISGRGWPIITVSPDGWPHAPKSCYTFAKECTAYALPNKGMVTQQRELSLSLHSTMAQCYLFDVLPPCCVFPILPETFFHPSPPYHPFVSTPRSLSLPFLLPIISRYFQQSRRNFVAHSNLRRPLRSLWPTYVLGRCSALSNRVRWDRR